MQNNISAPFAVYVGQPTASADSLASRIEARTAVAGIIGLGYVGLPLAVEIGREGFTTLGLDVSHGVVARINAGESHIQDVAGAHVASLVAAKMLSATTDISRLAE